MKCEMPIQNSRYAQIGSIQKLPRQMSLAAFVLPWAFFHMILRHWGCMRALRIVGDADKAGQGQYMSLTGLEFQVVKGRASQCKAREGFKNKARQVVALQGKAMQVFEVEANARLELDRWVRKSGGGWVSKSIQGSGENTLCVCRVVCRGV